jgi:hypothetical protein
VTNENLRKLEWLFAQDEVKRSKERAERKERARQTARIEDAKDGAWRETQRRMATDPLLKVETVKKIEDIDDRPGERLLERKGGRGL